MNLRSSFLIGHHYDNQHEITDDFRHVEIDTTSQYPR